MKKHLLIICGAIVLLVLTVLGIKVSVSNPTVDFRGEITAIETSDDAYIFTLKGIDATRYTVYAYIDTDVHYCHSEDGDISVEKIKLGDTIQGNYKKWASKENEAKEIVVDFH